MRDSLQPTINSGYSVRARKHLWQHLRELSSAACAGQTVLRINPIIWMQEQQNDMFKDAARHDPSRERVGPSDLVWDHLSRKPQAFLNPLGQQKWPLLVCGREQPLLAWIPCKVLPWGKCLARWYVPSSRLDPDPLCDSKPITVVKHHHEPSGKVGNQVEKWGTMWGSTVPAMGRL